MTERRLSVSTRPRLSRGRVVLAAGFLLAVVLLATAPRAPQRTIAAAGSAAASVVRGAYHIHTNRSDGALDKAAVAAAAARAGLRFAVFTDHGDGTRVPDAPAYIDGVLCIDAVEISTNQGHYVAMGIGAAPYPLGGDADAVVEDVSRMGGFGVAAHPVSARPELGWSDWQAPFDGLEWMNADSEWRDETVLRLARGLLDYVWRPPAALASLLDRPVGALGRWDAAATSRRIVGLAAHDAHGGLGAENGSASGRRVHVPSYESSFRTFSVNVTPEPQLTGDAAADARSILTAIREGRVFTALDAVASPAGLTFVATSEGKSIAMGGELTGTGAARLSVQAAVPADGRIVLLRNGRAIAESATGQLEHDASLPGAYRVEIRTARAPGTPPVPWVVSNPIYRFTHVPPGASPRRVVASRSLMPGEWRVEADGESAGQVTREAGAVSLEYRLGDGPPASQFVALVADLADVPPDLDTLVVRGHARQPMRVSAQLRYADDRGRRWRRSIYLADQVEREVRIALDAMRPADGEARQAAGAAGNASTGASRPPLSRATSILFVVDLTNAKPGARGRVTLSDVAFVRQAAD